MKLIKKLSNKVEVLRNRVEFVDKKFEKLYFELDMQIKQIYIEHGKILREQDKVLIHHGKMLGEQGKILVEHGKILKENSKKLEIVERDYGLMLEYYQKKIQSL